MTLPLTTFQPVLCFHSCPLPSPTYYSFSDLSKSDERWWCVGLIRLHRPLYRRQQPSQPSNHNFSHFSTRTAILCIYTTSPSTAPPTLQLARQAPIGPSRQPHATAGRNPSNRARSSPLASSPHAPHRACFRDANNVQAEKSTLQSEQITVPQVPLCMADCNASPRTDRAAVCMGAGCAGNNFSSRNFVGGEEAPGCGTQSGCR